MGVPVQVDSDDLETLLFATGVVRNLEAALDAGRKDQQWQQAQPHIAGTIDRVAHAWRAAKKPKEQPIPPTAMELQMLLALDKKGATSDQGIEIDDPHTYRHMVAKGWVKIGVWQHRLLWNTEAAPEYQQASHQRLKLTDAALAYVRHSTSVANMVKPRRLFAWWRRSNEH